MKNSKKRFWLVLVYIVIIALYLIIRFRGEYLSILELGSNYVEVFNQNLKYSLMVLLFNFTFIFIHIYITNMFIKRGLKNFFEEDKIEMPKLPNKSIALILASLISVIVEQMLTQKAMLTMNATWFGISDPIFNLDIGYLFFQKPFLEFILYYILILVGVLTVYTFVYYIIAFNVYFDGINKDTLKQNTFVKHFCVNFLLIAFLIASITFISTQNILNEKFINTEIGSETTAIFGAGLTDVIFKVWGYRILAFIIIVASFMAVKYFRNDKRKQAFFTLCAIPTYLVGLFIIMTGFQFLYVNSNELDREKTYIAYNIENTKKAYNINIEEKEMSNSGVITIEQVANNRQIIDNVPIITKDVTLKSLEEYQNVTGYYTYRNTNLAVYPIEERNTLLYISPREIESDNRRTYDSKTYEYTHGYGVILSDAVKADENGNIQYIQKSFDNSDEIINIREPRIYFGMETNSNIIINSKNKKEFDYPKTSSTNAENTYLGNAGLNLNFFDRLILGIKNGDLNLAFNANKDAKIITNRNVITRAKTLMPYLLYDKSPYIVIREDGSLVWVLDAYTTSNYYPYSQESIIDVNDLKMKINYIRNSIKVIIDAYNGTMQFYLTDRSDPIAMAYRNMYPDLFKTSEEIPQDISKHLLYPKFLYDIQANMLARYHNVQTDVLYRNDDTWAIAKISGSRTTAVQKVGSDMESYYTMLKTVDAEEQEMGLVIPYTPINKQKINAYLVGKYNNQNVLTLYKFRTDDNVLGVMQLDNQIERDEQISQELNKITETGSRLIKNMIVVPVDSTLLYIEPIYQILLNETQIPILKKVVVASGNRVAIGDNFEMALNNLLSQQSVELEVQNTDTQEGLIDAIIKANNNLEESSNNKDWDLIGKDIGKLQTLIKQLENLLKDEKKKKLLNNVISNTIDVEDVDINLVNEIVNQIE